MAAKAQRALPQWRERVLQATKRRPHINAGRVYPYASEKRGGHNVTQ